MGVLDDLLMVQEHDTALAGLKRRHDAMPERAELKAATERAAAIMVELEVAQKVRDEHLTKERRLDDEAKSLAAKAADVDKKLYSGSTNSPRELRDMQSEVEALRKRQRQLEDEELEVMVLREGADADVTAIEARLQEVDAEMSRLATAIAEQEQEIEQAVQAESAARAERFGAVPVELQTLYETVRVKNRGIGAAKLVGGVCQGCRLALPTMEVEAIKKLPKDEVVQSSECGCILVR